jgi:hypothetical protein
MANSFEHSNSNSTPNQFLQAELIEDAFAEKVAIHLSHWDFGDQAVKGVSEAEFKTEEQEIFNIEKFRCYFMRQLDTSTALGRTEVDFACTKENIHAWGNLLETVQQAAEGKDQFNILVTGLSIAGKATLRRLVTNVFLQDNPQKVASIDRDYMRYPKDLMLQQGVNVIEDMHGLDQKPPYDQDIAMYDLVLYVQPSEVSHIKMIASRGKVWQEATHRKADLTDPDSKIEDNVLEKMFQSMRSQGKAYRSRQQVLTEDEPVLEKLSQRIPVIRIDTSAIVELAYA